jgi:acetate kinase
MILVINSGSSSIKFKLFTDNRKVIVDGMAERIGIDGSLTINYRGHEQTKSYAFSDHEIALKTVLDQLIALKVIQNLNEIQGVGFRVVHGGKLSTAAIINEQVYAEIKAAVKLAPLHNPGAIVAIDAIKKLLPNSVEVACFDTAFHQTMPEVNYLYPTPYDWYTDYGVRKYGFHGISFQYITQKMGELLNKKTSELNLVVLHLGNGASACAIQFGKSLDTSMGLTPLAGLMMGTRSGDVDPSIIQYMVQNAKSDVDEVTRQLNHESGLKGVSGISADMRDITAAYHEQNPRAILALERYTQTIADYLVRYVNLLHAKVDAIVFTAGIGEHSVIVRKMVLEKAVLLNSAIDDEQNEATHGINLISQADSRYPIYVVPTDEESMICQETQRLMH